jgi:hypothetical protein
MLRALRWVLIIPAAIAAWLAAFYIGIGLYEIVESLCPAKYNLYGHCDAPWFPTAAKALIAFGAALAAILIMITCTLLAPSHKRQVAIATFCVGTLAAIAMGWNIEVAPTVSAIVAGGAMLVILLLRSAR